MSHQSPRGGRRLALALSLVLLSVVALVFSPARTSEAGSQSTGAKANAQACPTCARNEPPDVARFRSQVGDIKPVLVELKDAPGAVRRHAAERRGQRMKAGDLARYGQELYGKQTDFARTLGGRNVRALLRETDVRQLDGSVRRVSYRMTYLLNGFVAYVAADDIARLRALPEVAAVTEIQPTVFHLDKAIDYSLGTQATIPARRAAVYGATQEFQPAGTPGHPEAPQEAAQKADGYEGQGLNIAIIDSGVDYRHPMFGGTGLLTPLPRISGAPESPNDNKKVIYFYSFSNSPGDPTDDFGHGTLVASTAAGFLVDGNTPPRLGFGIGFDGQGAGPTPGGRRFFGTAPQAKIMAYKVCGPAPQCPGDIPLSIEDAASPFTLVASGTGLPTPVAKPVADVINLSLGDTSGDPTAPSARAANNAALAGTIVVASAGNEGPGAGTIGSPSAATLALSVAASLDPGSISGADVLAPNQIPGETRLPAPGPSPEVGSTSNQNTQQPNERQGIKLFPVAGGGALPTEQTPGEPADDNNGSVSAHYVFVDRTDVAAPIPTSVTNRIAVVRFTGAFASAANSLAAFNPAAILLVTAIESATAVAVVNGIPTFTISEADGDYLLDRLSSTDDNAVDPAQGAVSELPLRLAESISPSAFQGSMAGFSSRGPNDHANARFRTVKPDMTAPGVGIQGAATVEGIPDDTVGLASVTGYTQANGTSFSGPLTAGAITLVRQRVREELGLDTTDLGDPLYRTKRYDTVTIARALLQNTATNLRDGLGRPQGGRVSTTTVNDLGAGHINIAGALAAKSIMVAPTRLLADPDGSGARAAEFTRPTGADAPPDADYDQQGNLRVLIPTASFGSVPAANIAATVVRTQEVIVRDVTQGGGAGEYRLAVNNNRNIDAPGFTVTLVASPASTTPISSVVVPANGRASFFVRVSADGEQITGDGSEFMWYVAATPAAGGERLRMPFYYRAVNAALGIVTSPVQAEPENTDAPQPQPTPACPQDSDGSYRLRFSYTTPNGGQAPAGFRVQEATRSDEVFFDPADELLVAGANSRWSGSAQWATLTNPTTGSPAYFAPDAVEQDESLTMIDAVTLPAGGATLSFDTTQDFEENFDYGHVEASADGVNFRTLAQFTGTYTGSRSIDLSEFAGGPVRVRFRVTSDLINDQAEGGWYVENIRISADDFRTIAIINDPAATSYDVTGRLTGTYLYRVGALFATPEGNATGPYSNTRCVTVKLPEQLALDDAYVRGATPDTNFGSAPELQVKRTFQPQNGKGRRTFLKFDTGGFTGGTRFIVRLYGRLSDASVSNIRAAIFAVPDTSWQEETITWNNQPTGQPGALDEELVTDNSPRFYDFDVTAYVLAERAAGRPVVSFVIRNLDRTGSGDVFTRFNSKEAADNRPVLIMQP